MVLKIQVCRRIKMSRSTFYRKMKQLNPAFYKKIKHKKLLASGEVRAILNTLGYSCVAEKYIADLFQ